MRYIVYAPEHLALAALLFYIAHRHGSTPLMVAAATYTAFLLYFFRGYDAAAIKPHDDHILSPAEGVVKEVQVVNGQRRIVTFLSPLNRHAQVMPITGRVASSVHKPGEFHPAYALEKSDLNERRDTIIEHPTKGSVTVSQIAGTLARSIMAFVAPGERHDQGAPLGLIKFGSRVDVTVPLSAKVLVRRGDRVSIGDVLATW